MVETRKSENDIPEGEEGGIARELASLAAIQLLKSFLATHPYVCCPEPFEGAAKAAYSCEPCVSTDGIASTFSRTASFKENPWISGLEGVPCLIDACTIHQAFGCDIGYDGPPSIRSTESLAGDPDGCVVPSSSARPVEPWRSGQQVRWLDHPGEPTHVSHKHWWRKASLVSDPKSAVQTNSPQYGSSSLGKRFRRSKSLTTVKTVLGSPKQNSRERRRKSREVSIFSDSPVFMPTPTRVGYSPDVIAIAGVMIATGELDRLSSRANKVAEARAGNRAETSSPVLTLSPSGQPNTPVSMSDSPRQQGLKLAKGSFPTFVPTNTPVSGSRTPVETSSPPYFSRRDSQIGPSHLSEAHTPMSIPQEKARKDYISLPRLDFSSPIPKEQSEHLTTDSIDKALNTPKDNAKPKPYTPPLENTGKCASWKSTSELCPGLPSPFDASQTAASNGDEEQATDTPTPGGVLEPRETWTRLRSLGNIQGVLNEKPPLST
ncbi:hypothetical protein V8F20_011912 [Naviculisporaceae sp. PSN 640]